MNKCRGGNRCNLRIKSFHEVRHAKSGRIAYEATTQDGNKVLFHNIDNHRP